MNVLVLVGARGPKVVQASTGADEMLFRLVTRLFRAIAPPPSHSHVFVLLNASHFCSWPPLRATLPRSLLEARLPVKVTQLSLILRSESHLRQQFAVLDAM